jgi:hypothetical protein
MSVRPLAIVHRSILDGDRGSTSRLQAYIPPFIVIDQPRNGEKRFTSDMHHIEVRARMCARRSDDDLPASMFVVLVPCGQAKLAGSIRTWSDKPRRFRKETFLHDFRSGPDTLVGKGFILETRLGEHLP